MAPAAKKITGFEMKNTLARGGIEFLAVLLGLSGSLSIDSIVKEKDQKEQNTKILHTYGISRHLIPLLMRSNVISILSFLIKQHAKEHLPMSGDYGCYRKYKNALKKLDSPK